MVRRFFTPLAASLVLLTGSLASSTLLESSATASGPLLQSATIGSYHGALVDSTHHSIYLLTSEVGGHVRCSGACLSHWPPVLVKNSVMSVSVGAGVSGHVGFLHRPGAEKQVTFNGYPLYWFAGDSAPGQDHGVGISAFGGTWLLVHAGAHTSGATPFAAAMMSTTLQAAKVGKSTLLVNSSGRTLYLLSSEKGAKIKCAGGCLNFWPPLLVADSVTHVSVGMGVMGKVGFVARGATMKQVTVNGYPVYTYAGDTKAGATTGEGVKALGGVWYVVNAAATSAPKTPITTISSTPTTTTNGY
ncbi:MAG: hypothetical protein HKL87_05510 [Acidimicrobiaceae bacterium]|nr:hypothetical protein [Acidimicrobiaceae bacterium]